MIAKGQKALAALTEEPGLLPSTSMVLTTSVTPVLGDSVPTSGLQGTMDVWYTDV